MRRKWTDKERNRLKRLYPNTPTRDIAKALGRTESQVYNQALALGLKKSEEYLNSPAAGRLVKGDPRGTGSRFLKGQPAWNRGKKGYMGANRTSFRKGQLPHNTRSDGEERIQKDKCGKKYIYVRIGLAVWVPKHHAVWEANYGKIPKGMIIAFKDRDTLNCKPDNLELITRAENMKRNSLQRFPEALKTTIRALSKLNKIINEHGKGQD